MKNILIVLLCLFTWILSSQNISSINNGASINNDLIYTVGEIYVIPINEDNANDGIIGIISRIEFFTIGINDELITTDFRVYPNPTTNKLYFTTNLPFSKVYIYNTNGKLILFKNINSDAIDLTNLIPGNYIIKTDNLKIKSLKIIKK